MLICLYVCMHGDGEGRHATEQQIRPMPCLPPYLGETIRQGASGFLVRRMLLNRHEILLLPKRHQLVLPPAPRVHLLQVLTHLQGQIIGLGDCTWRRRAPVSRLFRAIPAPRNAGIKGGGRTARPGVDG